MQGEIYGRHGRWEPGGILISSPERLWEEISYIAYHFHWSLDEILDLENAQRRVFIENIANINKRMSGD